MLTFLNAAKKINGINSECCLRHLHGSAAQQEEYYPSQAAKSIANPSRRTAEIEGAQPFPMIIAQRGRYGSLVQDRIEMRKNVILNMPHWMASSKRLFHIWNISFYFWIFRKMNISQFTGF